MPYGVWTGSPANWQVPLEDSRLQTTWLNVGGQQVYATGKKHLMGKVEQENPPQKFNSEHGSPAKPMQKSKARETYSRVVCWRKRQQPVGEKVPAAFSSGNSKIQNRSDAAPAESRETNFESTLIPSLHKKAVGLGMGPQPFKGLRSGLLLKH